MKNRTEMKNGYWVYVQGTRNWFGPFQEIQTAEQCVIALLGDLHKTGSITIHTEKKEGTEEGTQRK